MARCRYCYETGHNQRTCTKKTQRMKEAHDYWIEQGHPDAWAVKQYKERIAPKKRNQTCGYCEERGHTRRKCEVLQKDREWFVQHHNEHVLAAHDYIVSSPVGIGSLFRIRHRNYDYAANRYYYKYTMFVLTDFEVVGAVHYDGIRIRGVLRTMGDYDERRVDIRDYVRSFVKEEEGPSNRITLVNPEVGVIPSNWVQRQIIDFASTANHSFFVRSGQKRHDTREYVFSNLEVVRSRIERWEGADSTAYAHRIEESKNFLTKYTVVHNRAKIFEDFKSEQ